VANACRGILLGALVAGEPVSHVVLDPLESPPRAERILVVRLGAMGDVLRTLPAVAALRAAYPDAGLSWLVEETGAAALAHRAIVDRVVVAPRDALRADLRAAAPGRAFSRARRLLRRLRAARFDLVIDFHGIARSAMLCRATAAPLRAGYAAPVAREGAWRVLNLRAELAPGARTRFERNAALVRFLGVETDDAAAGYRLDVDASRRARMRAALGGGDAPVVLHPGSSPGTPHKRWPAGHWAALAHALAAEGLRPLVTTGPLPEERRCAEAIVAACDGAATAAPATPDFEDLAALLACARVFVGADSGALHAASLAGTPVVQILGPTHPLENRPWSGVPFRQLRAGLECSPCRRGCAAAACMRAVAVAPVVDAVRELAGARAGRARLTVLPGGAAG